MISILCPTRRRPKELARMVASARATSGSEVVCYVDDDDPIQREACNVLGVACVVGPRIMLTECWNKCLPLATGEIFVQGNDDMAFRTPGWDAIVEEAFAQCPDRILMTHGQDMPGYGHGESFGPFPMVHRRWIEAVGYFIPPYFSSDYGDAWVNDLANRVGRRRYLPFRVEHLHFSEPYRKALLDETYRERLERHEHDQVRALWDKLEGRRVEDAAKLRAAMNGAWPLSPVLQRSAPVIAKSAPLARGVTGRTCPRCISSATSVSNGVTRCNQCGHQF